jgi:hydroxyethylthiazole kinase-like uncharacterized protein yjeF
MTNVLTADQMRAADAFAIETLHIPSLTLMENAATRVVEILLQKFSAPRETLVVCGKGNNGGDGMAAARLLKNAGWNPKLLLIGKASELKADPAANWKRALEAGVVCVEDPDGSQLNASLTVRDLVIDALFGTGITEPLEGVYSTVVQRMNQSGKEIFAIDVPSGLTSDSGILIGPCVKASTTIALAALKFCHVISPACKMCGEIFVVDIGISSNTTTKIVRAEDVRRVLPYRPVDSNKGTFGHAVIIGGSRGKSGAPFFSGKAALRCGAGLVTIACPSEIQSIVAGYGPEIMTIPSDHTQEVLTFLAEKNAVAIGPGIGTDRKTAEFFREIIANVDGALVIDADGLNHLAHDKSILQQREESSTILTPHPGEMARLRNCQVAEIQKDRIGAAKSFSAETGAIVVLKGYRTVIADPDGDVWINLTGGQSLASGGTGDVLTGIIAGLLAQRLKPVEAAIAGVYLHGLCSTLFEVKYPQQAMNAMDILSWWNEAVALVRSRKDVEGEYLKIHFPV